MKLRDKVAIVTGGARGIGRAIAVAFAREGARVVIADIRMELANETVAEIERIGSAALAVEANVSNVDDLDRMVKTALGHFSRIDILCNIAGIGGGTGDLFAYTELDWDRTIAINLKSAFFASQMVARVMIDSGHGGAILNTASTSAYIASSRATIPYDVSKAGIRHMTVSLAAHLADHGIRVNAIAPGTIETELGLMPGVDPEARRIRLTKRAQERIPLKRLGQPEDLAGASVFLCSEDANYITGHVLVVDGGILLI
ncbi:MAG: SDR family oxidoreductase [Hyphomicrobiales bacterium]|nr:SDR family oxidoreductase [Hyphomicrobiales bacterium]